MNHGCSILHCNLVGIVAKPAGQKCGTVDRDFPAGNRPILEIRSGRENVFINWGRVLIEVSAAASQKLLDKFSNFQLI